MATWQPQLSQAMRAWPDLLARRGDMGGKALRAVMLPLGHFLQVDDNVPGSWRGMVPDIFNALARRMNFTFSVAFSSDGKWGGKDKVN